MNWDRGLKRITLILSIIGAVITAMYYFIDEAPKGLNEALIGTVFGAGLGFCGVWGVYFGTKWGALPLYKWISVGFREDKQKDLKKTNE